MADFSSTTCPLLVGFESAKWLPFEPFLFLERMAIVGAPVVAGSEGGVWYGEPTTPSEEHDFLKGWHIGCRGAAAMVAKALRENKHIQWAHRRLMEMRADEWKRESKSAA